ncbi:MAG TPA: NAD(P)/FAD-dependent oxidoreductase [Candidatus Sulfotelmatobacter sp.]|nr:NAD(P)/FAD-dependent oxidoreductase [Candidatus Sulfotelmatobacter sp.]
MPQRFSYDAVVVGSGPNGLAAAIRLAQEDLSVLVLEAQPSLGGGTRSAELTLPGFVHDVCSAIHPLGLGSPFFRQLPLEHYGLQWIQPGAPLAHPLDDGTAAVLQRPLAETAAALGKDELAYLRLMAPLVAHWENLAWEFLQPLLHVPRHPLQLAQFGWRAMRPAAELAQGWFAGQPARALLAGLAAHSFLPLEEIPSAAFGLVLGLLGHAVGWPLPRGGAQSIANALAAHLRSLGGEILTHSPVESLDQLPLARAILLDLTPRQVLRLAGHKLPVSYQRRLERYRYGPGVFKIDYALAAPIPWKAAACRRAGTVHVGGPLEDVVAAEDQVAQGRPPERPFVLLAQPTLFDPTRAPAGRHIAWAYCHVPNGSAFDMTARIEDQIERFAPGFRDCVLARHTFNCAQLERHDANLVGGDINGGATDLWQLLARPALSPTPYRTPVPGLYLCSAATPPGGGVHGMCGFHAAEVVLHDRIGCGPIDEAPCLDGREGYSPSLRIRPRV